MSGTVQTGCADGICPAGRTAQGIDKKVILRAVSLGEEDISLLREFDQSGVEVAVHIVPEEVKMPFAEIEKKYRES